MTCLVNNKRIALGNDRPLHDTSVRFRKRRDSTLRSRRADDWAFVTQLRTLDEPLRLSSLRPRDLGQGVLHPTDHRETSQGKGEVRYRKLGERLSDVMHTYWR